MIHRSQFADIAIPDVALTPFVLRKDRRLSSKAALIDATDGRTLTYAELWSAVRRVASGLAELGFACQHVLAIYSPNAIEHPIALHAAALLGGATTTLNPTCTQQEAHCQLLDSAATILVTVPALCERARAACVGTSVREIVVIGEPSFARLYQHQEWPQQVALDPREHVVALPYSSGTTGLCKGVMLTHRNLVANTVQLASTKLFDEHDTLVCVLPMFHIYGMVAILAQAFHMGSTVVVLPRFDFESLLGVLQDRRVSFAHLVPPILLKLAKDPLVERFDLSSLKTIFSGAAPLSEELTIACERRLHCQIKQGYGMTESSPATHVSPREAKCCKPGSAGMLVPNTECAVVDVDGGHFVGVNETGELWVRGPQVMKGYLGNPQASARTVDREGWLHTGDLGYVDSDGMLFVVDRLKELIKVKGFQVAPAELEALLTEHACVADAAVIPVPDDAAGELPKAFVVKKGNVEACELIEFVSARVAPHKRLREVEFVSEIPKSPSGKILRRVLVQRERERRG